MTNSKDLVIYQQTYGKQPYKPLSVFLIQLKSCSIKSQSSAVDTLVQPKSESMALPASTGQVS